MYFFFEKSSLLKFVLYIKFWLLNFAAHMFLGHKLSQFNVKKKQVITILYCFFSFSKAIHDDLNNIINNRITLEN